MKSPLRYPGGKNRAKQLLHDEIIRANGGYPEVLVSPFCGGCSVELTFNASNKVICHDASRQLINFWNQAKNNNKQLTDELWREVGKITKDDFTTFKEELKTEYDELYSAYYYFIVNRCSFSGCTMSGGFSEAASKSRFTHNSISNVRSLKLDNYEFHCSDFIKSIPAAEGFIFCDPPYLLENSVLYGSRGDLHKTFNHKLFHDLITSSDQPWLICYNDLPAIRNLYSDYIISEVKWAYGMNKNKISNEILITKL